VEHFNFGRRYAGPFTTILNILKMDLGSLIIGAIIVLLCILPFILIQIRNNKRDNKKLLDLSNSAKEHDCKITRHEFCGNYLIGMDEVNNFVFFHKIVEDRLIRQFVDLSAIEKSEVVKATRTYTEKEGTAHVIEKLELAFIPNRKGGEVPLMEFYNEEVSLQLNGELQSIERWSLLINERVLA